VVVEGDQDVGLRIVGGNASERCGISDESVPVGASLGSGEEADEVDEISCKGQMPMIGTPGWLG
jgi:hypothetical protein